MGAMTDGRSESPSAPAGAAPRRAGFIVGVPRSGTTMLNALLDGHPQAMILPVETKVFEWCGSADPVTDLLAGTGYRYQFSGRDGRRGAAGAAEQAAFEAALRRRIPGPLDPGAALQAVADSLAELRPAPGARLWIEKTPKHLRSVPLLLDRFGRDTPVVVVMRDPRGVFSSQSKRWNRPGVRSARRFARRWATSERMTAGFLRDYPAVLLARYEDLVLEPRPSLERVLRHFGLDWDDCVLGTSRLGDAFSVHSSFGDETRGVSRAPLERWREHLSSEEITAIEELLAPYMRRHGYEPTQGREASAFSWRRRRMEVAMRYKLITTARGWQRDIAARASAGGPA